MTKKYRAVFFDFDGTLHIPSPSPIDAFIEYAGRLNIEINPHRQYVLHIWAHHYWSQHEQIHRDMDQMGDDFWIHYSQLLLKAVKAESNLGNNARTIRNWFQTDYRPIVSLAPAAYETLQTLKERGYILGLISNRTNPLTDAVREIGLEGLFVYTLAAGEIECWKPNPEIFNYALSHFSDLLPEACLYVGDNYYADGHGAAAAGLRPVLYDPDNLYSRQPYARIRSIAELLPLLGEKE